MLLNQNFWETYGQLTIFKVINTAKTLQLLQTIASVNDIHQNSTCKMKQASAFQFPELVSRFQLSKTHVVKSIFIKNTHHSTKNVDVFQLFSNLELLKNSRN